MAILVAMRFLLTLLSLMTSANAFAHPLDFAILVIQGSRPNFEVRLEMNPQIGAVLSHLSPESVTEPILLTHGDEIFQATLKKSHVSLSGINCTWAHDFKVAVDGPQVLSVSAHLTCANPVSEKATGNLKIDLPFLKTLSSTYNLVAKIKIDNQERMTGADPLHWQISLPLEEQSSPPFAHFVKMGIAHIGAWPSEWLNPDNSLRLPLGIDHILFVLALLLSGGAFFDLLKIITGFTIGHTISLALGALGWIHVSAQWIEAIIALTIALVAAENLLKFKISFQWKVALGIGLIHGLGFAAALSSMRLNSENLLKSILGFNLGVELGQGAIAVIFLPALFGLRKHGWGQKIIVPGMSFILFLVATFWFIERVRRVLS